MPSFFSNIQSLFSADYDGRYLGLILQEIGNKHRQLLWGFIAESLGIPKKSITTPQFRAEYCFDSRKGKRRADLAVFDGDSSVPVVLIEIKYFDKLIPEKGNNLSQTDAYLLWMKETVYGKVLVLSRENLNAPGLTVKRWGDLVRYMRKHNSREYELISLFITYLEEKGVAMQNLDEKQLIAFLKRILCSWQGAGRAAGNLGGAAEFSSLLSNMKLTAEVFDRYFKNGGEKKVKAATVDFVTWCYSTAEKDDSGQVLVNDANRTGGGVRVFAQNSFHDSINEKASWMLFSFGIELEVEPKNSTNSLSHPKAYLYAQVTGKELKKSIPEGRICVMKKISFSDIASRADARLEKIEGIYRNLLIQTAKQLLQSNVKLSTVQSKRINILLSDLQS